MIVVSGLLFAAWLGVVDSGPELPEDPFAELGRIDPPEVDVPPPDAPPQGVIGDESRQALSNFKPEDPVSFPGWEAVLDSVVQFDCNGDHDNLGTAVLLDRPDRVLTAAHAVQDMDGALYPDLEHCAVWRDGSPQVAIRPETIVVGPYRVPDALYDDFSTEIARGDWAIVDLVGPVEGGKPLRLATKDELILAVGQPVLNLSGPSDSDTFLTSTAQICRYIGPPPTSSSLAPDGSIVGRPAEPADTWLVARYDCDAGRGSSGSPIIGWSTEGKPVIWGILTDSLRGRLVCPYPGWSTCYSAGPLATAMAP
ncbi:trypsin-like serine peptidase [Tabrizicola sp.]|uniref:trypsin-like serine peptidase n=1 Tax=Tabrizicola sp. TaxID=2005166 RepID=UPI003F38C16C